MLVDFLKRLVRARPIVGAYRVAILPLLRAQPFPSTLLGPVKGTHPSVSRWIQEQRSSGDLDHTIIGFGDRIQIRNEAPILGIPKVPNHFRLNAAHHTPAPYVASIRKARVATRYLEAIAPDDHAFEDQFPSEGGERAGGVSLFLPQLPRLKRKPGRYALICTGRASNYYHWLNDCLPRLRWLEEPGAGEFSLLVPEKLLSFQSQTLDALGYTRGRRTSFGHQHWQVDELLIPSLANQPSQSSPDACRWLRDRLLQTLPRLDGDKPFPKRVYISRTRATKRRLLNEPELVDRLSRHGIVSMQTETLTFAEQARLFEGAELVVAPHGAGLTNILFMRPDTLVIELVPILKPKTCYVSLASAMGVRYACVTDAPDDSTPEPAGRQPDRDFTVPCERVIDALETLGLTVTARASHIVGGC